MISVSKYLVKDLLRKRYDESEVSTVLGSQVKVSTPLQWLRQDGRPGVLASSAGLGITPVAANACRSSCVYSSASLLHCQVPAVAVRRRIKRRRTKRVKRRRR